MATLRRFEEPKAHADWAHSRAQILALDAPQQVASHRSMAEFTSDQTMAAGTVPKTVPTELAVGSRGTRSASAICS